VQAGAQPGERVVGEREMAVGQAGGAVGFPRDDGPGQGGMLPQRPAAHLGVYGSASKPRPTSRRIRADSSVSRELCVARAIAWCSAWSASREASRPAACAYAPTARRIVSMSSADRRSAAVRAICCSMSRR
jgi:hypothetical protein